MPVRYKRLVEPLRIIIHKIIGVIEVRRCTQRTQQQATDVRSLLNAVGVHPDVVRAASHRQPITERPLCTQSDRGALVVAVFLDDPVLIDIADTQVIAAVFITSADAQRVLKRQSCLENFFIMIITSFESFPPYGRSLVPLAIV